MIEFDKELETQLGSATIKVIGVGGAGGNTINSMIETGSYEGIEFIVANTDAQALRLSKAGHKIQLGVKSTKGLGSGANPELGRRAAEEDLDKVLEAVGEADIVFLAGGMGGGTGSGALPVIARALKSNGILTIAVVTKPFVFEGKRRTRIADQAIVFLEKDVDTLIVIPNQKLLDVVDNKVSMINAFSMINEILNLSVKGISDIITKPGHINVDFADMREIMRGMGLAIMGTGKASGENRAREAAEQAISSPLLENMSIVGARGVLLNISGGLDLGLHEISEAASVIYEKADENANIILGSVIDPSLENEVIVTIIATGFNPVEKEQDSHVDGAVRIAEEVVVGKREQKEDVAHNNDMHMNAENIKADDLDVPTFLRRQGSSASTDQTIE
jgi:cell division protein FtsZ